MKKLFFIRHGESVLNFERIFAGQIDTPLTDRGRDEAKAAGIEAKNTKINLIVSSPMSRALETAQIVAREIGYPIEKIITSDIFKEHYMGSLAGKSWNDYDEFDNPFDDAETWNQLLNRAKQGLEFLRGQPAENALLVGHGAFTKALQTVLDPNHDHPELPNAELVQLI